MVVRVFSRMAAMLGARWTFGAPLRTGADGRLIEPPELTDVGKVWAEGLGEISVDRLAFGIRAVEAQGPDWWPTLPAFVALCRGGDLPEQCGPAYRRYVPAVPALADSRPVEVRRAERMQRTAPMRDALRAAVRGPRGPVAGGAQ